MKRDLEPTLAYIATLPGFTLVRIEQGKHYKLRLTTPQGPRMLVVPRSVSDHRAHLNLRSVLRSWA